MSKLEKQLHDLLKSTPKARERVHKNRALAFILKEKIYPEALAEVSLDTLEQVVDNALYLDRKWRKLLEMHEDLRGSDYDRVRKYVQQAQLDNGYQGGFEQFRSTAKNLR